MSDKNCENVIYSMYFPEPCILKLKINITYDPTISPLHKCP